MYINLEPKNQLTKNFINGQTFVFLKDSFLVDKDGQTPIAKSLLNKIPEEDFLPLGFFRGEEKSLVLLDEALEIEGYEFISLRDYARMVGDVDFKIAGRAYLLAQYFWDNKFCGACGSKMEYQPVYNTYANKCNNCDHIAWHRVSTAIIVAVTKGDRLLLAHNKNYEKNIYSVLAGFVEYGESLEDAVKREIFEEVGIKVKDIRYFGSQAWPFPNSYMVGFNAEYESGEIEPDGIEIVDAKWFTKEEVMETRRPSISISARLIENFLNS